MKNFALLIAALMSLLSIGCAKDEEVLKFAADVETVATEIKSKVTNAKDLKAGVADAQNYLDGKKADLKAQAKDVASVRGFQVEEATLEKVEEAVSRSVLKVAGLQLSEVPKAMKDKEAAAALKKLIDDFQATATP